MQDKSIPMSPSNSFGRRQNLKITLGYMGKQWKDTDSAY